MSYARKNQRTILLPLIFPLDAYPFYGNPRQNPFTTNLITLDLPPIYRKGQLPAGIAESSQKVFAFKTMSKHVDVY